jgi:4-alpha-glucanotransferase
LDPQAGELLDRLSVLSGIDSHYYDNWGEKHLTTEETKRAILASMGITASDAALKHELNKEWLSLIEPVMVVSIDSQPASIPVHFPLEEGREKDITVALSVEDEAGRKDLVEIEGVSAVDSTVIDGTRYVRVELPNRTDRGIGYYSLSVLCRTPSAELSGHMRLIVAPERCYEPPGRTWGIYANLYALRSEQNWGIGDLTDLGKMLRWVAQDLGGGFIGINPLHAIPNKMPFGISPYSSTSRLYSNLIYLDMEKVNDSPEYRKLISSPEFTGAIEALRDSELIDYEKAASLKMRALRAAFEDFYERHLITGTSRAEDLKRYVGEEGRSLEGFALFSAIDEYLKEKNPNLYHWQDWPPEYHDPEGPAVAEFTKNHEKRVLFYQYVQWLIDRQLRDVSDEAKALGMSVGIYQDLAVGSSGGGSDAWSYPEVFAFGMDAGAPPDAFNLNGQSWGFPPLIPEKLRESGYELFIQTIRNNLKYAGALRIDHALGLFRLFWIPEGMSPTEGTYVRYPFEDLLRIIALESVRNRAVIIGEDLGTIGEEAREALSSFGMLSYRLFYFERDWNTGTFLPPEAYPEMALTAVTTHDLPTLPGYWAGRDIEVKTQLGIYPNEAAVENDISARERDRQLIIEALGHCLPDGFSPPEKMTQELSLCVHTHLGRTPCRLVAVSLDDVLEVPDQQNMPGTIDAHPNWRQKCPVLLGDIIKNEQAKALARMFREEL